LLVNHVAVDEDSEMGRACGQMPVSELFDTGSIQAGQQFMRGTQQTGSFFATTDEGDTVEILVHQNLVEPASSDSSSLRFETLEFWTIDGEPVNKVADGLYQIVCVKRTDRDFIEATTDDPNAP
ncbi:MAG: hypothetical protein R3C19_27080, partial [Planctomycetaceae bacterium]